MRMCIHIHKPDHVLLQLCVVYKYAYSCVYASSQTWSFVPGYIRAYGVTHQLSCVFIPRTKFQSFKWCIIIIMLMCGYMYIQDETPSFVCLYILHTLGYTFQVIFSFLFACIWIRVYVQDEAPAELAALLVERLIAKQAKDFGRADEIRDLCAAGRHSQCVAVCHSVLQHVKDFGRAGEIRGLCAAGRHTQKSARCLIYYVTCLSSWLLRICASGIRSRLSQKSACYFIYYVE